MGVSFDKLKKNRSKRLEQLSSELENMNSGGYKNPDDDKYWKLEVDSAGNGYAVIRFLDDPEFEQPPMIEMYSHGFQGPKGKWYIEKSLTTIGKDDPVSEMNTELWHSGIEANKEIARKRKRRLQYVSNILVVRDSKNPENEGKVFLFSYGKKIFSMLNDMMHPKFEDEEKVNPFDYFEGANFHLKAFNNEAGFRDYDKSRFDAPGPLTDKEGNELDEDECQAVIDQWRDLRELHDEKNFKSYDELKKKLYSVLELNDDDSVVEKAGADAEESEPEESPKKQKEEKPKKEKEAEPKKQKEESVDEDDEDEDEIDFDDIFSDLVDDD